MESKFKTKVSFLNQYDHCSSISYKVECDCHSDDHACIIDMEYDKDMNMINLMFYKDVSFDWWTGDTWHNPIIGRLKNYWNRIKKASKLLFTGEMRMSEEFMLIDVKHIESFIEALQEGLEYCKEEKIKLEEEYKQKKLEKEKEECPTTLA